MKYTIKFKSKTSLFWRKIDNVVADGFLPNNSTRYFIVDDDTRYEIPGDFIFWFSKERHLLIKEKMREE